MRAKLLKAEIVAKMNEGWTLYLSKGQYRLRSTPNAAGLTTWLECHGRSVHALLGMGAVKQVPHRHADPWWLERFEFTDAFAVELAMARPPKKSRPSAYRSG